MKFSPDCVARFAGFEAAWLPSNSLMMPVVLVDTGGTLVILLEL
jgi:hypothetical protein